MCVAGFRTTPRSRLHIAEIYRGLLRSYRIILLAFWLNIHMKYYHLADNLDPESQSILRDWALTRGNMAHWIEDNQGVITIAVDDRLGVMPTWTGLESAYPTWVVAYTPE